MTPTTSPCTRLRACSHNSNVPPGRKAQGSPRAQARDRREGGRSTATPRGAAPVRVLMLSLRSFGQPSGLLDGAFILCPSFLHQAFDVERPRRGSREGGGQEKGGEGQHRNGTLCSQLSSGRNHHKGIVEPPKSPLLCPRASCSRERSPSETVVILTGVHRAKRCALP